MEYIELKCTIKSGETDKAEQLTAILGELGFESFVEADNELLAYIPVEKYNSSILNDELLTPEIRNNVEFSVVVIPNQNWNAVWESNFQPVTIDNRCYIRAPFHPADPEIEFEIIIEPKMSFGTAHHETTFLMLKFLLELDLTGKAVLDMGCGTGVLAILTALKGCRDITAIDNDEWAYKNTLENIQSNNTPYINVYLGDASLLENRNYDVIIANINRNILLNDMSVYAKSLKANGLLLLSGFYYADLDVIKASALKSGLEFSTYKEKNNWVAASFNKLNT